MALTGSNNEEKIWNYLKAKLNNNFGVAGLMGNLYAESGLNPNNLQNSYEKSLGLSDVGYTAAVDNGTYTNFVQDKAGYGLAQWTYWSRKQNLYNFCKTRGTSIADLEMQLDFLWQELSTGYGTVLTGLKNATSVLQASNVVLLQFEKPADQSATVQNKRAGFGQTYYNKYASGKSTTSVESNTTTKGVENTMNIIKKTNAHNTTAKANRTINWIVIHYTAGVSSSKGAAQNTAAYFAKTANQASADFIVDDAEIVQYNPDLKNKYCWAVGGAKYTSMSTSLGGKYYGQCMNNNSVSIEMCSRKKNTATLNASDDDWYITDATINNTVQLTKYLMQLYNIDINHVIMHHMVNGKWCPQPWTKNENALNGWYDFLSKVKGAKVTAPVSTPQSSSTTPVIQGGNAVNYTVKINTETLNVRSGPGTTYSITTSVKKGGVYTIVAEQNGWGRLKSGVGWISLDYTIKNAAAQSNVTTPAPSALPYTAKVIADSLNIRKGPGTNYQIVGSIKLNEVYTIVEESNGFGKLKSGAGWVSLSYLKKN